MTPPVSTRALALLGSGEYLPVMNETDRLLLATVGGAAAARVALLPAASGLEPGAPERWNRLGAAHFRALGAEPVPLPLVRREDASDAAILEALRTANVFYFSGGNPNYLVECLEGTPAWAIIAERWRAGAALAGCSAGAMMLGACTLDLRSMVQRGTPAWRPALGAAPGLAVLPHFDRFAGRFGAETLAATTASAPPGVTVLGIDEDTALVRLETDGAPRWEVHGRGGVTVFARHGKPAVYRAGARVPLDA